MSRTVKYVVVACVVIIALMAGYLAGFLTTASMGLAQPKSELASGTQSVLKLMQSEALDPPSETTATVGAINGILQSNGDKYARYLPADAFKSYTESMEGSFGGIGVVLEEENGNVKIAQVYDGTPASQAGIQAGDWFYEVDGTQKDAWTVAEIQKLAKGEPGTEVTVTFCRPYTEADTMNMRYPLGVPYTVTLKRAVIQVPITKSEMLGKGVGYIRLFEFTRNCGEEVRKDIADLQAKDANKFILDLRDNPGGDLQQAISVASAFIESGVIVKIESRVDGNHELKTSGGCILADAPLVVLVDENSASASEIVAGALKDYERAKLVGMKTYGKGSVQTQMKFLSGAVLMTTAHYLSPKGHIINNVGVSPDVQVPMPLSGQKEHTSDIQLQEALRILWKK